MPPATPATEEEIETPSMKFGAATLNGARRSRFHTRRHGGWRTPPQPGMMPGRFLGKRATTAGSRLNVAATISTGVCASQSDSDTSS